MFESSFSNLFTAPENEISQVVFYPDRIYHARRLAAAHSPRYRYHVQAVRTKADLTMLRGAVFLDGVLLTTFVRIEYGAARLAELAREHGRHIGDRVVAWLRVTSGRGDVVVPSVTLHYDPAIAAHAVELWRTLEPPAVNRHDFSVIDLMGHDAVITRAPELDSVLDDLDSLRQVALAFHEPDRSSPAGYFIGNPHWDNNYGSSHEEPRDSGPSHANTVVDRNYLLDFSEGYFLHVDDVPPVRYRNAMMNDDDPECGDHNVIEMRWLLQRELGGSVIFSIT